MNNKYILISEQELLDRIEELKEKFSADDVYLF